ncbi:MAG: ribosome biogenesis GTPase Der [Lentimicrobiaceae bacterium]|jgi:GTP-binding protein|nr:ribosome biogenesis GTPase Der [Lentimicrobiaceae bacterium]MCP4909485.1 ribosome biogenesis GTPase Der [Bacteroidota bacterium]MBT3455144.1 ribosome biogenesis GTPase Der [Lentimicrobiaceae bacterium]MBT3819372.1 ribosome biogenesis GTPase Der [Lentimicrobiaceae bacterium]MBT4060908.1 ribosome biogenesis GTPase Der [Lentimicrobiaceae bacterium]
MNNTIAIVGRPNVGKSTLFNRLIQSKEAIVESVSGVTRDRIYGKSDWNGYEFSVIDTGGYVYGSDDTFEGEIRKQVEFAIDESDAIIFVVDSKEGINPLDEDVARLLRKSQKDIFVAANKIDTPDKSGEISEFYSFGLGNVYPLSAVNGGGTGDLLDDIVKVFPDKDMKDEEIDLPRIAFVGRPNVGKSSIINTLLGDVRNIVTDIAGTTRDSIYTRYNAYGHDFMLVDTAGLRKKGKVYENIEFYSTLRTIKAIENSDVCVVMIDAQTGIEKQDVNIFHLAEKNNKGIVLVVNKWDLINKETNTHLKFESDLKERIAPFVDIPIVFTSVKEKQRIHKTLELASEVYERRKYRVSTSELNDLLLPIIENNPPPMGSRGRYIKIKYITQLKTSTPMFAFFCNLPDDIKEPYKRFIENQIRKHYNFTGVPIQIFFRKK